MQALPSFLQSLFLYALTSNTSMALRNGVSDRKSSVSHEAPTTYTQNGLPDRTANSFDFLLELSQSPEPEGLGRQNTRRLKFGSWVKYKTASPTFQSKHGRPYFPRAARARLERMPLAFGKRAWPQLWEHEHGDEFDRQARDRISRMPLTFGKRYPEKIYHDATSSSEADDFEAIPEVYSFDQNSRVENDDVAFLKRQSNRLTRMPITFGKRTRTSMGNYLIGKPGLENNGESDGNGNLQEEGSFNRQGRTSLSRMPLTFGRKKKAAGKHRGSVRRYDNANHGRSPASRNDMRDSLILNLVGKLASTAANGPQLSSLPEVKRDRQRVSNDVLENGVILTEGSPETKLAIHKSDEVARDSIKRNIPDDIYPYDAFPVERRAVINRMPLTFGKRERPASEMQLGGRYGYGQQDLDVVRTVNDQDKEWLYDGQDGEDENDTERTRNSRSRQSGGHMIPDGDDWADAL